MKTEKSKKAKRFSILTIAALLLAVLTSGYAGAYSSNAATGSSPAKSVLKKGDYVYFGKYNNEPILWRALNVDSKKNTLLWSDKIITLKALDATGILVGNRGDSERKRVGSNFWNQSSLRDWLNGNSSRVSFTHQPPDDARRR